MFFEYIDTRNVVYRSTCIINPENDEPRFFLKIERNNRVYYARNIGEKLGEIKNTKVFSYKNPNILSPDIELPEKALLGYKINNKTNYTFIQTGI